MKTKIFTGGLLLVIISLSYSCSRKKEEPTVNKEQVKAEIQAIENRFASIYIHRNIDSLTYYADDAISYFSGQKPIVGKAAIHQFIAEELKELPLGTRITNETLELFVTNDGNNVAEIGEYKRVDSTGKVIQTGHYFSFFAKRNGKYVCTRDMANSYPPDGQ
jgi:ketosteroid isomerase-like protein